MQLAEKNELPAFAFHRRFEGVKALRSFETPLQPAPPDGSANQKRNGGTGHIANQHNQESPPQAKKKSAADTQDPARQQQHVTAGVKDRVTNCAPNAPAHHPLLDCCQNFPERENVPRRDNESDHAENGEELNPSDAVCFFQERQTICASHLARKSGQLAGRIEMQEWRDQINGGKF